VYLKTLTLRGFKSFASATSLRFEPGITCVVGPNGSGKSNVVDALCWVMGEQGAKSLRGGKMEDVVFAGTSSRPPLGRAEVALTIDNSDGALPIDYSEVTISRLLFRSGQSEYAINGDQCRLLDVQDLLSDTGMGREMHVIIGQSQLDEVLHSGPEARRALIEEAAGVLKHRRRKEKALRKLDAMQANLTRLVDLTAELRRRLKPLGRQAAVARRAAVIQAELRDARLRLLADDYTVLRAELDREEAGEAIVAERRASIEAELAQAQRREAELEEAAAADAPRLASAQETWFALSSAAERLRGVAQLAEQRHRHLTAEEEPVRRGRDPEELDADAARVRAEEAELKQRLEADRARLAEAVSARSAADAALAEADRRVADRAREAAAADRRAAKLREQAEALRSRLATAQEESGRLSSAASDARARADRARQEHSEVQQQTAADGGVDRAGLEDQHEQAAAALPGIKERAGRLRAEEHQASQERAALHARAEALELSVRRGADAAEAVLGDPDRFGGVLGPVATVLTVDDGAQAAVAAALGAAAEAVAVTDLEAAASVLTELRGQDAGRIGMVVGTGASVAAASARAGDTSPDGRPGYVDGGAPVPRENLPTAVNYAVDLVRAPRELAAAVGALLAAVVVVDHLDVARDLVREHPELRAVTRDGDLLGRHWAHGGSANAPSLLELRAAAEETAERLAEADRRCEEARRELATALEAEENQQRLIAEAAARMHEADTAAAEVSGRLGRLSEAVRAAADEAARLDAAIEAAERSREADRERLADLEQRLDEAEAEARRLAADGGAEEPGGAGAEADGSLENASGDAAGREELTRSQDAARNAEMESRLAVRTAEERVRAISGRADSLASAAASERSARERARNRREQRARQAVTAQAVADGAAYAVRRVEEFVAIALAQRQQAEAAGKTRGAEQQQLRSRLRELTTEHDRLVDAVHSAEIARNEQRLRLQQMEGRAVEEFGVEAGTLVSEYGPDVPVPVLADDTVTPSGPAAGSGSAAVSRGARGAWGDGVPGGAMNGASGARGAGGADGAGADGADGAGRAGAMGDTGTSAVATGGPDGKGDGAPQRRIRYNRAEQERRARGAERQLAQLGKVNPLALEEFAALEERHTFLSSQLEDLKKTRRDLLTVIKEVDDRVQQVFASAFEDISREFEQVFSRLFPGGDGRLALTEPDDLLTSGIEVEARPPGKKVKRLSLLSGGERSLTAIAYLLAIFKARPSPFYVLDEVEAALDDVNLRRLLGIFEELRDSSQLIVITHQKPSMEIADALYGISMRGDGVSAVVSQRLHDRATV
jgi:chromosome segregation protein